MLKKLWNDEAGVVSLEYLLLATIVGLGLIVGFVALRNSMVSEFNELAGAITTLSQEYSFSGQAWAACASTEGSNATDSPDRDDTTNPAAASTQNVNDEACGAP